MHWGHVLAAADGSPAGLHAVRVAHSLARDARLRLTVVTVLAPGSDEVPAELAEFRPIVAHGVPAIEIVRVAEELRADLLVLGRTQYGEEETARLGPTADLVVRRSLIPCLFVPEAQDRFAQHLVALDGTERGYAVFESAREFVRLSGGSLQAVTVEPAEPSSGEALPQERSVRVANVLERIAREAGSRRRVALQVLRGEPVRMVRGVLKDPASDLLVVGARRGGPGGVSVSTGVGRMLLFTVHCAVLTVPL
jgi:nucleotide-binding universal stress UspA family protein